MSFHVEGVFMESAVPLSQRFARWLFLFLVAVFLAIPASSRSQADDLTFAVAKEGCNVYIGGWFRNVDGPAGVQRVMLIVLAQVGVAQIS